MPADHDQASDPYWLSYPGIKPPRYTQIPHAVIDELLPRLTESQLKVVLVIARATWGWRHSPVAALSLTDLAAKTGLSRRAIQRAVAQLEQLTVIIVHRERISARQSEINMYAIRLADPDPNDVWQQMPRRDASKTQTRFDL